MEAMLIPLATNGGETLPIMETGATVLVVSVLITLGWLLYLYR